MKARRILRPSSVRIGMFCRFGSDDDSRPVGGRGQRVAGVNAVRLGVDVARQRVGVGRAQLRHLPPVENLLRQFVALLGQFFQRARAGRPLPGLGLGAARQAHLAEQHVAELLRAAGIERLAGELADLVLEAAPASARTRRTAATAPGGRSRCRAAPCAPAPAPAAAPASRRRVDDMLGRPCRAFSTFHSRSVTSASSAAYSRGLLDRRRNRT